MAVSFRGSHGSRQPLQPRFKFFPVMLTYYTRKTTIKTWEPTYFGKREATLTSGEPRELTGPPLGLSRGFPWSNRGQDEILTSLSRRGVLPSLDVRGKESGKWEECTDPNVDSRRDPHCALLGRAAWECPPSHGDA
ncbi:hypothetical protein CRG98_043097 [Punica granatum]|uniref:Uncharacterized protein n=1 Tax=Punica granatum TaxID=22663 RepID=A0A2I0HXT7_PUNGR|nr:hypothetical protein CRG98_043097 [Punica granatum]